jgi:hypothetical protein
VCPNLWRTDSIALGWNSELNFYNALLVSNAGPAMPPSFLSVLLFCKQRRIQQRMFRGKYLPASALVWSKIKWREKCFDGFWDKLPNLFYVFMMEIWKYHIKSIRQNGHSAIKPNASYNLLRCDSSFLRIHFITHLLFTASKMTSDAAEVPASINKKHLDILQGTPDGWILRYCTYDAIIKF